MTHEDRVEIRRTKGDTLGHVRKERGQNMIE